MKRRQNNQFIIYILSIAGLGLTAESYMMGWEFWVPPLIILGIIGCWFLHITKEHNDDLNELFYFAFISFATFFHGVHSTSFFDVAVIVMLFLVTISRMDRIIFMRIYLLEYFIIMLVQLLMAIKGTEVLVDPLTVSRIFLHIAAVFFVYLNCARTIQERIDIRKEDIEKDKKIEEYDEDIEDFLSNISHELRTPINVVNGMSDLLIRKNTGKEANSIKEAGIRMLNQIEDVQDYTEAKSKKLTLEEEEYMSTSLINDVVTYFRGKHSKQNLELVVDFSPNLPNKMIGDIKKLHKLFRHLLDNAIKFTKEGGICVSMFTEETPYGVNLCIEVTDTGIGMDRKTIALAGDSMYQKNKKRDRTTGGIGLGLYIVYGFAHRMGGFVHIESEPGAGTTVRVTVPQKIADKTPCLKTKTESNNNILFFIRPDKYKVARVREFYQTMVTRLDSEMEVRLYAAESLSDVKRTINECNISHIFTGEEEYRENVAYFDEISRGKIIVSVAADEESHHDRESSVLFISKPLYAYPITRVLNEGKGAENLDKISKKERPDLEGIRALIVDDEPMNLVVASGLFKNYGMLVETAGSGKESIEKFKKNHYDIIYMDHMMPEMDGVEAMHRIRKVSKEESRSVAVVALTANVVSGAKEMFVREGFDGFIAKPINKADFERVMLRIFPDHRIVSEV
ncbi:MAG: response regulator [Lachnospiraceae bacterium]|nr:response regulator [Lachnospiraceae bacterium]